MYGSKIASIRKARGLKQGEVAEKLGMSQASYSDIENNNRKYLDEALIEKIAEALGVKTEDIKSQSPIVMNFHESPNSNGYQTNQNDSRVIDALLDQLRVKDEQLAAKDEIIKRLLDSKS
ncbi:MAG: helix-turn-helix domain-containing protein [Flavobacteriales bacterium]|nr:helix-turn-helix domain-containing protein [Flavobacteriales bacterium]